MQAFKWLKLAAEQGLATAQYSVGVSFQLGHGVAKSYAAALVWYTRAADQKLAHAQYQLGKFHAEGRGGLARDHVVAARHMQLAADQGNANAEKWLEDKKQKQKLLRSIVAARAQRAAAQAAVANVPPAQAAWAGLSASPHAAIHSQASAVQATSGMVSAATATTPTRGGGRGGKAPATTPTAQPSAQHRRHQLQGNAAVLSPGSTGVLTPITFTPLPVGDDTSGTLGTHHQSK